MTLTPQQIRRERLIQDNAQMRRLNGRIIQVTSFGDPPEKYVLTIRVRTVVGSGPQYRDEHKVRVTLPAAYPTKAPEIVMLTQPQPFHPNWWPHGLWCYGTWNMAESLGNHVLRMVRTLQFDPEITYPESSANQDARRWYLAHRGLFPCDRQVLPDPEGPAGPVPSKKFVIQSR